MNRISARSCRRPARSRSPRRWPKDGDAEDKIRKILKIAKEPISMETPDRRRRRLAIWAISSRTSQWSADRRRHPSPARNHDAAKDSTRLTPREEPKVLRMRFGIEMNTDHTLEEVGKQFDDL